MRIGSSIGLAAQFTLLQANQQMDLASVRLATMQRINSGADDPAGLIMAEQLRMELTAINAATDNAARAGAVVQTADSALGEVSSLLNTIQGNVVAGASGGRSEAELAALQMENDAALEAINRIGHTTSFAGEKLLDGTEKTFALSPDVSNTATLSLPSISTSDLGAPAGLLIDLSGGGSASLTDGDPAVAASILDAASSQVLGARARLGAFEKHTIDSTVGVLEGLEQNLSRAFSNVFDTDVAKETSRLARSQILADMSVSSLLIGGQRSSQIGTLLGSF